MEIQACPTCGSKNIQMGTTKEGITFGVTSWKSICKDCGYQGEPIIFDSEKVYKQFIAEIKNEIDKKEQSSSNIKQMTEEDVSMEFSEKEEEVVKFLNEVAEEVGINKENLEDNVTLKQPAGKILNNPISTLGLVLIVVGVLITAASLGFGIIFTGALIFVGFILFIVGIISPKEQLPKPINAKPEDDKYRESSMPLAAGILLLLSGVLSLFIWISILFLDSKMIDPSIILRIGLKISVEDALSILKTCATIGVILSIFPILGGIFAVKKKLWGMSFLGGILGIFLIGPLYSASILSLIGLIIIILSKKDFS